jgi:hypothetical protein
MKNFEIGKTYNMKWIGDADLVTPIKVVGRTAKTVKLQEGDKTYSCRIKIDNDGEYVKPYGSYSMAPVLRAIREVA